ncbi:MAG: 4Fe-4S dicluster domain-containing protein [Candidatus Omnitrophota bacterium]|nr:4Fe-4S dicluster domain-containing protein [Candidatus Omnitrophota bacterium]
MIEELRVKARDLLKNKQVELVIGYQRSPDGVSAAPCFAENENDADLLIWDAYCVYNLSSYLKDHPGKKIGIVVKDCDVRSIVVLLQENQLKRENLFIIGVECHGVIDEKRLATAGAQGQEISFAKKCRSCKPSMLQLYDFLIKEKEKKEPVLKVEQDEYEPVRKLEAKSQAERLKFWQEEFSRCIRCYACRQVCPLCYCPKCVAEQTMPSWFSKGTNLEGNFSWNVVRAMHLAGRCIDCGECDRACPVGIPLREINKKIEKDVLELFSYEAGSSAEAKPLLACFDKNDPDSFIK